MRDNDNSEKRGWFDRLKAVFEAANADAPDEKADPIVIPHLEQVRVEGQSMPPVARRSAETDARLASADSVALRTAMLNHLTVDQLHALAAELNVPLDTLQGGKGRQVLALMQAVSAETLLDACRRAHPNISWPRPTTRQTDKPTP